MIEIDDGKKDCMIQYQGKTVMLMTEDGYTAIGLSYEQAKNVTVLLSTILAEIVNGLTSAEES